MNLYAQIQQFFERDFSGLPTFIFLESSTRAQVIPRPNIIGAPHLADYAPRLKVSGGLLYNPLGTSQTLEFSVEYPNPVQSEPHLIVDIYTSDDGTTYTVDTTTPYDSLPVTVTTNKKYILGVIRTDDSTPKVLFTTRDAEKQYRPLDVRTNSADLITYSYSGNTLKGTFPVFFDSVNETLVLDFDYRGTESFSDSSLSFSSGDAIKLKSWDGTLAQLVLVGNYHDGVYQLPKEQLFTVGSTQLISGEVISRVVELKTLVDTLIVLAVMRSLTSAPNRFDTLWAEFTSLPVDSTTNLYYSKYGLEGAAATQLVDIAANAYLALRFLSSGIQELIDFVTVPSGGQTFLDRIGNVVSVSDGYLLHDSYDGSTYKNDFTGFTEGMFYLLERLVEKEYPSLSPSSFDSAQTLTSIANYVDVSGGQVYASKKELDGDPNAPTRTSLDLASLLAALDSVPITQTEDYSQHVSLVKQELLLFKIQNWSGIPINTNPNSPDYNPYWSVTPPITGYINKETDIEIDTKISLLVGAITGDATLYPELGGMVTSEGVLYVDMANTAEDKFIVPNLHATVLNALYPATTQFIKTSSYTVRVLDDLPNNVTVTQIPADSGVILDITLDYPSGIVVLAVGDTSGTTFDSTIVPTSVTTHQVYVKIPVVSETVKLYVVPTRPFTVT